MFIYFDKLYYIDTSLVKCMHFDELYYTDLVLFPLDKTSSKFDKNTFI